MTLKTFRRMIEAFFRRWPIYVAILAASIGFGIMTISGTEDLYTSRGTVFVENQSLVTSQSGIATPAAFSYLTAAQTTSDQLRGLLQTDIFLASVVARTNANLLPGPSIDLDEPAGDSTDDESYDYNLASVRPPPDPLAWAEQATDLRNSVNVYAVNENLMSVDATTVDPELSYALSIAIIEELIQFQITLDVAESAASENFFLDLAGSYEQDVIDTRQAVDDALRQVDTADEEEVSDLEQREIDRLREAEVLASARYRGALDEVELARLLSLQTQTDIQQSFSVFDPPRLPTEPDRSLVGELRILISAAAVGLALALLVPIVVGLLQRTVLFPDDLDGVASVLSVVPKAHRSTLRLTKVEPEESDGTAPEAVRRVHTQATQTLTYDSTDLELESLEASPAAPAGFVDSSAQTGEPIAAGSLLAEIEANTPDAPTPDRHEQEGSVTPADPAPLDSNGADEHGQPHPAPVAGSPVPVEGVGDGANAPAVNGNHGSTDSSDTESPVVEADDGPSPAERIGTQTGTFRPIQGLPVAPPAPPGRRDQGSTGSVTGGPPRPPGVPSRTAEATGTVDPTVTAEISSPPSQHAGAPPMAPGPMPGQSTNSGEQGFTVQARNDDQDPARLAPPAERAAASDSGSEADDTTETNLA